MAIKLRYNESTGKLCGNSEELDACCRMKCDPCQMQMDLVVSDLGGPGALLFCNDSNGTFRLRPTDTPTMPPAPPEACITDPFSAFICFLESDTFEITDVTTETFRWAVRVAQHENGTDWVITVSWYNVDHTMAFWWVGTVLGDGVIENIDFCFGGLEQCANIGGICDPFDASVCGTAIETDLSRCDFQCADEYLLTVDGISDGTCPDCDDLNGDVIVAEGSEMLTVTECGWVGTCHWNAIVEIIGGGGGCPNFIETGLSIRPVAGDGDGPPWDVYAFYRVLIDEVWYHVVWMRENVNQLCCELDVEFTVEEICDVSEAGECDLTGATMHVLAGASVS